MLSTKQTLDKNKFMHFLDKDKGLDYRNLDSKENSMLDMRNGGQPCIAPCGLAQL